MEESTDSNTDVFKVPTFLPEKHQSKHTEVKTRGESISCNTQTVDSNDFEPGEMSGSPQSAELTMEESTNSNTDVFKVPTLLPEKPPSKHIEAETRGESISSNTQTVDSSDFEPGEKSVSPETAESVESSTVSSSASNCAKPSKVKISTQPIPYNEPSWGGLPDVAYSLEEMKSGVSLRVIPLDHRSFFCFGRFDNCHIVMAHPTVSRYHAVLQFRSTFSAGDERKGFYLFDLGSTHGTFLNKERIKPRTYVKLQVGHMIKFGSSTRCFLLHGPEDDQEEESQYSYTQLCEMRKQAMEKRQKDCLRDGAKLYGEGEEAKEEESQGIDWGMGEDADEETDLTENPFAETLNEELYIDDPKKTLRGWFDREGEELNYKIEEKGFGQFRCSIELPIESASGGYVVAEAVISGKKKEAAHHCALEACRILDRAGLLRQSNQESRKRKLKNWEEDDYYDSDEDNFFDRTGDLEIKRKQRMNQVKKTEPTTDTYETLIEKHKVVVEEIEEMERKLNTLLVEASSTGVDDENWDSFTSQKRSGQILDKLELRKLRNSLTTLKTNEEKLRKLINFVKPFELPEIRPPPPVVIQEPNEQKIPECTEQKIPPRKRPVEIPKANVSSKDTKRLEPAKTCSEEKSEVVPTPNSTDDFVPSSTKKPVPKPPNPSKGKKVVTSYSNQYEEDFNNIVWTPPAGQTGDGRTSLNDKLGY